jgi:hypothetical protein
MAAKPKRKQKTKPKLSDKAQSERFKQTARELGVGQNEEFAKIVAKLAKQAPKSI